MNSDLTSTGTYSSFLACCGSLSAIHASRLTTTYHLLAELRVRHRTALIPFALIKGDLQGGAHYATSTSA